MNHFLISYTVATQLITEKHCLTALRVEMKKVHDQLVYENDH